MAMDSGKAQDKEQGEEQKKKRDEKFLKFAREYQEKIGNNIEMQIDKPSNMEFKTISQIETRINLLLPENYSCSKECIVCIENPYGAWGETFDMETVEDYEEDDIEEENDDDNKISDEEVLEMKENELLQELEMVRENQEKLLNTWEKEGRPSVKAAIENEYKKQERKEKKIVEKLYDRMIIDEYPIFQKFTITERKLYEILLEYIPWEKDKDNPVNVRAIKNKGWGIVKRQERREIYDLFSEAVKENQEKWKLSDNDLVMVWGKLFCPEYIKIIFMKEKLLKIGTPSGWMEIIEKNSETEEDVINNLKKLERVLKKLGIEQQIEKDSEPKKYTTKMYEEELEKIYKERKAETSEQ